MNIIIAVDENYIEHAKTMLYSLACNNREHLDVYLLQSTILRERLDEFSRFMEKKAHGTLHTVAIPADVFAKVPKNDRMSVETYFRLLSFSLLPESVERALWLDADIIVKDDITAFYYQDFQGKLAVCCAEKKQKHHDRLQISRTHLYFNAGVILFNLAEMRRAFKESDVFDCIEQYREQLKLMDQDVLNLMLADRVKYAEAAVYNNGAYGFSVIGKKKMRQLKKTAKIIHYWGSIKPWNWKGANWADRYWWKYEWKRGRIRETVDYRFRNIPVKTGLLRRELRIIIKNARKAAKRSGVIK